MPASEAEAFARRLLRESEIEPIGLGARDSLRLEAGLCLYGHELDETIDPIEAGLAWSIQKRRRVEGGFPGAGRVQASARRRPAAAAASASGSKGARPRAKAPKSSAPSGEADRPRDVGRLRPQRRRADRHGLRRQRPRRAGTPLALMVRGKPLDARVAPLPFHPHAYYRG